MENTRKSLGKMTKYQSVPAGITTAAENQTQPQKLQHWVDRLVPERNIPKYSRHKEKQSKLSKQTHREAQAGAAATACTTEQFMCPRNVPSHTKPNIKWLEDSLS